MGRQIKFRGYNLKNKQWLYGYYLVNRGKHYIVQDEVVEPFSESSDFEVDPEPVGQWIGNGNGVDVYEGDIVNMVYGDNILNFHGKIAWNNLLCQYELKREDFGSHPLSMEKDFLKYEVIGNEYEQKMEGKQ